MTVSAKLAHSIRRRLSRVLQLRGLDPPGEIIGETGKRPRQPLMPLEILHVALVLFRSRARFEGAEIAALAGLRIHLSGIEPVLARLQFADHDTLPPSRIPRINRDGRALVPRWS